MTQTPARLCTGANRTRLCPQRNRCKRYLDYLEADASQPVSIDSAPRYPHECWRLLPVRQAGSEKL